MTLALLIGAANSTRATFVRVQVDTIVADRCAAAVSPDSAHAALYGAAYAIRASEHQPPGVAWRHALDESA